MHVIGGVHRRTSTADQVAGKVLENAANGHRRESTQRTQRTGFHRFAQIFEQCNVRVGAFAVTDPLDHFDAAHRADPARRALAARFVRAELHRELRLLAEVDGVVERDDAAVPEHRRMRGKRFVVERCIPQRRRQIGAERSADLNRAQRSSGQTAAAEVLQHACARTHRTAVRRCRRSRRFRRAETASVPRDRPVPSAAYAFAAAAEDGRYRREREHVVDQRRLAEQPADCRHRRLEPDETALAFEALEQRRLFAADVRAGAHPQLDVERADLRRTRRDRAGRRGVPRSTRAPVRRARADIPNASTRSPAPRPSRSRRSACLRSAGTDPPRSTTGPQTFRSRPRRHCTRRTSTGRSRRERFATSLPPGMPRRRDRAIRRFVSHRRSVVAVSVRARVSPSKPPLAR